MISAGTIGRGRGGRFAGALALLLLHAMVSSSPVAAHERIDPQDRILQSIGVDEHPGDRVPGDATFRDHAGTTVRLGDYFGNGPILLTLNYYTCPMLCPLTLRNLLATANEIEGISLGTDYRVLTISIDPADTVGLAKARAGEIHALMEGVPDPSARWPFLVGDPAAIEAVTRAVGFRYRKVGEDFAHPDVNVVLTPEGKISRYLYGVVQDPPTLKLALIEAAGGKIGKSEILNRVLLYCFQYDPVGRTYALYARNIMRAGGVLTLVLLGTLYIVLWKRRKTPPAPPDGGSG
ncbi:MAG TPA: SCO family protein [Candidatus Deferrimicrobiaceae bacterium]